MADWPDARLWKHRADARGGSNPSPDSVQHAAAPLLGGVLPTPQFSWTIRTSPLLMVSPDERRPCQDSANSGRQPAEPVA